MNTNVKPEIGTEFFKITHTRDEPQQRTKNAPDQL